MEESLNDNSQLRRVFLKVFPLKTAANTGWKVFAAATKFGLKRFDLFTSTDYLNTEMRINIFTHDYTTGTFLEAYFPGEWGCILTLFVLNQPS